MRSYDARYGGFEANIVFAEGTDKVAGAVGFIWHADVKCLGFSDGCKAPLSTLLATTQVEAKSAHPPLSSFNAKVCRTHFLTASFSMLDEYEAGFRCMKRSRKLTWIHALDHVDLELEVNGRPLETSCSSFQVAVILLFEDRGMHNSLANLKQSRFL